MPALTKPRTTLSAPCLVRVKIKARSIGLMPQHVDEHDRLGSPIDADDALFDALDRRGDRRHGNLDRVAQHLRGQFNNGAQAWWPRTAASAVRTGSLETILRMSWMKPMSSIRSASSMHEEFDPPR